MRKNYRPVYRDIKNWIVLDERTINDFSDDENPIKVVNVLIGTLHYEELDFHQHYIDHRTPITRWLTEKEYKNLCKNEGTIIW